MREEINWHISFNDKIKKNGLNGLHYMICKGLEFFEANYILNQNAVNYM